MSAHAVMRGSSMQPLLHDGMLLQLQPAVKLARGQIAVFKAGERLVAHRVVRARGSTIVCCGDAQPDRLDFVAASDVLGIVRAVYRCEGARVRRIDNALFRARGMAFAYLHPLRAVFERIAPRRRERTYHVLVQAAAAIVRGDSQGLLRAVEEAMPLRLAATAKRHRMAATLCTALEPLRANAFARAACEALRDARATNAECRPSLDGAGAAMHLRDIFVLAQMLAAVNGRDRGEVDRALERMHCSARLGNAALFLASGMAGIDRNADAPTRRFATWMLQREDLPAVLRACPECVDAWFAADGGSIAALLRAALQRRTVRSAIARLASAAAIAVYLAVMR